MAVSGGEALTRARRERRRARSLAKLYRNPPRWRRDFGAGAANLNLLLRLPFDTLKLDRALVAALTTSDSAARVVGAVSALAHELRLEVVAEGVETPAQLAAARAAGCDRVQGYLAARPTPWPQDTPTRLGDLAG